MDGGVRGPFDDDLMLCAIRDGVLVRGTLVKCEGVPGWKPVDFCEEFAPAFSSDGRPVAEEAKPESSAVPGEVEWYFSQKGQTLGPVKPNQIVEWLRAGATDAVVAKVGEDVWLPISESPFAGVEVSRPASTGWGKKKTALALAVVGGVWLFAIGWIVLDGLGYEPWLMDSGVTPKLRPSQRRVSVTAQPSASLAELAAPYIAKADARWAAFDALPKAQQSKTTMGATIHELDDWIVEVPESVRGFVAAHVQKRMRQHSSIWSSVGSFATGPDATDLVPNGSRPQCLLWASMWVNDVSTLTAIMSLGYKRIVCPPDKTWVLKDEAAVCFLWTRVSDDPNEKGTAFVWSSVAYLEKAREVGARTDDEGPMAFMALWHQGAKGIVGGTKATITDTGPGWFRVVGDRFSGYVEQGACHHTADK